MVEDEETLLLVNRAGLDNTTEEGMEQRTGEGIAAQVSENGEGILVPAEGEESDERLIARNGEMLPAEGPVFSLMATPLVFQEKQIGVIEVINKNDGQPFDEDDLFLLTTISEAAALALHNCQPGKC